MFRCLLTMKVLTRFLVLFLFLVTAVNLSGAPATGLQSRSKPKKAADRLQVLQREFPKLADSALAPKKIELKIWTLASLADLLWATNPAPTLILADSDAAVRGYWVGQLTPGREAEIRNGLVK